jgi:hypothetical protein
MISNTGIACETVLFQKCRMAFIAERVSNPASGYYQAASIPVSREMQYRDKGPLYKFTLVEDHDQGMSA